MLLRRITQHLKEQNWFAVFLDFFIVVVGVFIGIQVANWDDSRKDRADEALFLEDLHEDIMRVSAQSARTQAKRYAMSSELESATSLIFSDKPERELTQSECGAIAYSFVTYVGRSKFPSLIQLQSSGRTGILTDRLLARKLAELTQLYEALDALIREVPFIQIVTQYPNTFPTESSLNTVAGFDGLERDAETQCRLSSIRSNRALLNDIALNADAFDAFMRNGFVPWVDQMQEVHERVDVLLGIQHKETDS